MSKSTRIAAAALCLVGVGLVNPAGAGQSDAKGPACSDYDSGEAYYDYDAANPPGQPTVYATLVTAAATCTNVTYTFYVLDGSGQQLLASSSQAGNGTSGSVSWKIPVPVDPLEPATSVCVYATSGNATHEMDRAPDSKPCYEIKIAERPGQTWK